jgi:hypothetical protein
VTPAPDDKAADREENKAPTPALAMADKEKKTLAPAPATVEVKAISAAIGGGEQSETVEEDNHDDELNDSTKAGVVVGPFVAAAARRQTLRLQGKHLALDLALGEAEEWTRVRRCWR